MNNLLENSPANSFVAVIGGCGIGLTMNVKRFPEAGETIGGATFSKGAGGKASNQAIGIRRLGLDVALFTIIGADDHGELLRQLWHAECVNTDSVVVGTQHTMIGSILVDDAGENRIIVAPGALDELTTAALVGFAVRIEAAAALLASLEVPVATVVEALVRAHAAGVLTVLNPAPAAGLPDEAWAAADHITPNRTEAAELARLDAGSEPDALVDGLRRCFNGVIALTLGADGVLIDDLTHREHVPAIAVDAVVDSTGAGDAFSAAYTVALVEGAEPVEAARFATRAGAFAVTREEVIPALPRRSDLEAFVTEHTIAAPGT